MIAIDSENNSFNDCVILKSTATHRDNMLSPIILEQHFNKEVSVHKLLTPESSKFPTLYPDMMTKIQSALSFGPLDRILVEKFGLRIKKMDLLTLRDLNWVNNQVINFYMDLLIQRSLNNDACLNIYAMNSFFYGCLFCHKTEETAKNFGVMMDPKLTLMPRTVKRSAKARNVVTCSS